MCVGKDKLNSRLTLGVIILLYFFFNDHGQLRNPIRLLVLDGEDRRIATFTPVVNVHLPFARRVGALINESGAAEPFPCQRRWSLPLSAPDPAPDGRGARLGPSR